ncbi:hypothetical protein P0Y35_00575 [Kiritimatiellaeota bacterium B1221]|nr:hypothetical protein [Kiritimatiellaeota bacterium B1221]
MRLRILLIVAGLTGISLLTQKMGQKKEGAISQELIQVATRIAEVIDVNQPVVIIELGTPLLGGGDISADNFEKALQAQGIQSVEREQIWVSEQALPRLGYGTLPEEMAADYFQLLERHADSPCIVSLVGAPEAHLFKSNREHSGQKRILVDSLGIGMADFRKLLQTGIIDLAFTPSGMDASSGLSAVTAENLNYGE